MTHLHVAIQLSTLLFMMVSLACGMRGPPLAPLVIVPAQISNFSAERFEDDVYIRVEIPEANEDGSEPAELDRVEIYALTTQPEEDQPQLSLDDWLDLATLIATFPIEDFDRETGDEERSSEDQFYVQGEEVTIVEALTGEVLVPVKIEIENEEKSEADEKSVDNVSLRGPFVAPPLPRPARRTYVALSISPRGRESSPSPRVAVPLGSSPRAPSRPIVSYSEDMMSIVWTPPLTARLPISQPPINHQFGMVSIPEALVAFPFLSSVTLVPLQIPSRYEIYDVSEPLKDDVSKDDAIRIPQPLTLEPLASPAHSESEVTFGIERCFVVRMRDAVGLTDDLHVRSEPSEVACVNFVDTFPPVAPTGLVAVSSDGVISLIWTANTENDVSGYFVLRGPSLGATLTPLNVELVEVTNYRDTTVEAGMSYVYAIQAVDSAPEPNLSPLSEWVMEQAR